MARIGRFGSGIGSWGWWAAGGLALVLSACGTTGVDGQSAGSLGGNGKECPGGAGRLSSNTEIVFTDGGAKAKVDFTVAEGCENVELSLVSYKAPTPVYSEANADQQVLFDAKTMAFSAGEHHLVVNVPDCFYQVDFVFGKPIEKLGPAGSDNFYGKQGRLIEAANGGILPCEPDKGKLKPRKVYDFVGDRAGTPYVGFELNGEYDYPEPIVGGWPIRVTPVDENGTATGLALETTTMQELSPTDGRYLELPVGRYRVEELMPTFTMDGGVWSQTGANVTAGGVTTPLGTSSSVIVAVTKDETTVVRFFNVCRVDDVVQTFPAAAMEDMNAHDWACKPSFLVPLRK